MKISKETTIELTPEEAGETYERFLFDDAVTTKDVFNKIDYDIRRKEDYLDIDDYLEKYKMDKGIL